MEEKMIYQVFINHFEPNKTKETIQSKLEEDSLYTVFRVSRDGTIPCKILHCTVKNLLRVYDLAVKNKDMAFSYIKE